MHCDSVIVEAGNDIARLIGGGCSRSSTKGYLLQSLLI